MIVVNIMVELLGGLDGLVTVLFGGVVGFLGLFRIGLLIAQFYHPKLAFGILLTILVAPVWDYFFPSHSGWH